MIILAAIHDVEYMLLAFVLVNDGFCLRLYLDIELLACLVAAIQQPVTMHLLPCSHEQVRDVDATQIGEHVTSTSKTGTAEDGAGLSVTNIEPSPVSSHVRLKSGKALRIAESFSAEGAWRRLLTYPFERLAASSNRF